MKYLNQYLQKLLFFSLLLLTFPLWAQLNTNGFPGNTISNRHPFLDASQFITGPNNQGKGLLFPTTDLTQWTFDTSAGVLDGINFPTYYDGMIVYNTGTGNTLAGQGQQIVVAPGFYYFRNPGVVPTGDPAALVANGVWVSISDGATVFPWELNGNSGIATTTFLGTTDAQPIRFRTNNIERAVIDASGNVGIGINAPAAQLHIEGSNAKINLSDLNNTSNNVSIGMYHGGTGGKGMGINWNDNTHTDGGLIFQSLNNTGGFVANQFFLGRDGSMGIGTTAPASNLHVVGTARISGVTANGNTTSDRVVTTNANGALRSLTPAQIVTAGGGGVDTNTNIANTNLTLDASRSLTTGSHDLNIDANTLFIDGDANNVGIGTNAPVEKLDVRGEAFLGLMTTVASQGKLTLGRSNNPTVRFHEIEVRNNNTASGNWMRFHLHDAATSSSTITPLTLRGDNRVGIGTTAPTASLHVSGTTRLTAVPTTNGNTTSDRVVTTNANGVLRSLTPAEIVTAGGGGADTHIGNTNLTLTGNRTLTTGTNNLNIDANTLFVDGGDDRVGIGTNAPTASLHVNGTVRIENLSDALNTDRLVTIDADGNLRRSSTSYASDIAIQYAGAEEIITAGRGGAYFVVGEEHIEKTIEQVHMRIFELDGGTYVNDDVQVTISKRDGNSTAIVSIMNNINAAIADVNHNFKAIILPANTTNFVDQDGTTVIGNTGGNMLRNFVLRRGDIIYLDVTVNGARQHRGLSVTLITR